MSIKRTKGILGLVIAICMLVSLVSASISVSAASYSNAYFTVGNFTYRLNSAGDGAILMYIKTGVNLTGEVVVPDYVDYAENTVDYNYGDKTKYPEVYGSKKVYALQGAFTNKGSQTAGITRIVLPDHMTTFVNNLQFQACRSLTSIHLPAQLNDPLVSAFSECPNIDTVELPAALTALGKAGNPAFAGSGVKSVIITTNSQVDFTYAWPTTAAGMQAYYPTGGTAPKGSGFTATAYGAFTDGWVYSISGTGADAFVVLRDTANTGAVTIPDTLGGVKVGYIKEMCFQGKQSITELVLSDNVTRIESNAFAKMSNLSKIELSPNLVSGTTGGDNDKTLKGTFQYCSNLKECVIPDGITTLENTFRYGTGLEKLTVPASITSIPGVLDGYKDDMSTITVFAPVGSTAETLFEALGCTMGSKPVVKHPIYFADGDFKYRTNSLGTKAIVTGLNDGVTITNLVLPESVTHDEVTYEVYAIDNEAFVGNQDIESVVMPDTYTTVLTNTFYGCSNLKEVKLSKNLTGTMQGTFAYCSKLKSCVIPSGVTKLIKTFMYCHAIRTVVIPETVTAIEGDSATDVRERLFSIYPVEEGEYTGAPLEPSFVVYGKEGSAIDTYMQEKGWNFVARDFTTPLELGIPSISSEDNTASISVVNAGTDEVSGDMTVYCAYYNKITHELVKIALIPLSSVDAVSSVDITANMDILFDKDSMCARAFVWKNGTLEPLAEFTELSIDEAE